MTERPSDQQRADKPRELRAVGVARMHDNDQAVLVCFDRKPTDDELRDVHDTLAGRPTARSAGTRILDQDDEQFLAEAREVVARGDKSPEVHARDRIDYRRAKLLLRLAGVTHSASEPTYEQLRDAYARMRKALDDIYNHNEATRAAVIQYYGLWHDRANATDATSDSRATPK